jgi:hypothetical protein
MVSPLIAAGSGRKAHHRQDVNARRLLSSHRSAGYRPGLRMSHLGRGISPSRRAADLILPGFSMVKLRPKTAVFPTD